MPGFLPSKSELQQVNSLVQLAREHNTGLKRLLDNLLNDFSADSELQKHVHSMKSRVKDPDHLRDKLLRKLGDYKTKGQNFPITERNLFIKINDLAGLRILHLHTRQFEHIDLCLSRIFDEHFYNVIEKPSARTWDDESRAYFESIGIKCVRSSSMYTSVHYVIAPNQRTTYTCEIQVRTIAEELWGEVDHSLNYPHETSSLACREQIKVLARVTSSCTRLVDSIFASHADHKPPSANRPKP